MNYVKYYHTLILIKELKRKSVNGKRLYENPWGEPVPSVTTIPIKQSLKKNVKHFNAGKNVLEKKKHNAL